MEAANKKVNATDIQSNVIYALETRPISEVVALMVEHKISSVLVHDEQKNIVGIVTERDIVRKFTLVDLDGKMTRPIATIMTRGVKFVTTNNLYKQIIDLHLKYRIRHFPILIAKEQKVENVLGIMSITDFLRRFILDKKEETVVPKDSPAIPLGILSTLAYYEAYRNVFTDLGFTISQVQDFNEFFKKQPKGKASGLIFDMDGYTPEQLKQMVPLVRKYPGKTAYATSNHLMLAPFRKGLNKDLQAIALKPLDISYFSWFFGRG